MRFTAEDLRGYLLTELLPLWRDHGRDRERGGFLYHLDHDRVPAENPERRVRVQARQTWVFSRAAAMAGGAWARDVAARGYDELLERFHDPVHGGFWLMTTPAGEPLDRRKELYEHAFVMLASAAWFVVSDDPRARRVADEIWGLVGTHLADPAHGGFFDGADEAWQPAREVRRQNPHMHLFEALLAWSSADPGGPWLARADAIRELLERRFFDAQANVLVEYFDSVWRRAAPPEGDVVEPGHHFEWVFLLEEHSRLRGRAPWCDTSARLFDWAERHGVDPAGGVHDDVHRDGSVRRATKRVWPQTEYLRALATRHRYRGERADLDRIREVLDFLWSHYVIDAHGGWMEQLDPGGRIATVHMHATTVYHVMGALLAATDALDEPSPSAREERGPR
jgi:mannose/cellobiose epimerase-like protein (N-acyl-D-glucosamine 2-epimerase family)